MKAYSDYKTVYIKQKHKKRRVKQLMHYVSTAERQIIKFSSKDISKFNLGTTIKAKGQSCSTTFDVIN